MPTQMLPLLPPLIKTKPFPQTFVVQLLSRVQLCAIPWTEAPRASLSFAISWSLRPASHCRLQGRPHFPEWETEAQRGEVA